VITFTKESVIKDFLAKIYAETVSTFPAFFTINSSDSSVNHVTLIREKTPAIENIQVELEKYKNTIANKMKENKKSKNLVDKGKELFNKGKDLAKTVLKTKPKDIGKLFKNKEKNKK